MTCSVRTFASSLRCQMLADKIAAREYSENNRSTCEKKSESTGYESSSKVTAKGDVQACKQRWRPPPGPKRVAEVNTLASGNCSPSARSRMPSAKSTWIQISAGFGSHSRIFFNTEITANPLL